MDKEIIIIDGNSLLFRAYYATSYGDVDSIMRTSKGTPTNAIFAFGNMLCKILRGVKKGDSIFVGFDCDSHTFRKEEFADYKANRKPAPQELITQFPISRELLDALGIKHYEEHGIEADDICGTVAKNASKAGYKVTIYTSDKDYLQLVDKNITVSLLKVGLSKMEEVTDENIRELYGLTPSQIIDYKGLRGDSSDNYPGIPGVGEKTAVKLLEEYGDFPTIIQAAKDGKISGKVGQNIVKYEDQANKSFHLAHIIIDANLPFGLEDLVYEGYDMAKVSEFSEKYELRQLPVRLPVGFKKESSKNDDKLTAVLSTETPIENLIGLFLDMEYSDYHESELYGVSIFDGSKSTYYAIEDIMKNDELQKSLQSPSIKKSVFDAKATSYVLSKFSIEIEGIEDDIMLAAYLLESSNPSDIVSSFRMFGADIDELSLLPLQTEREDRANKISRNCYILHNKIDAKLASINANDLYHKMEIPLANVLMKMEKEGITVDKDILEAYGREFVRKRDEASEAVFLLAGKRFNLNSPKQIADVLFNDLKLRSTKGNSTSVEALSSIADDHPIVPLILRFRKYSKLVSTYTDGLIPHIKKDGKIHTYFNQALTTTGRLSSSSPNLQNISSIDEESKKIKEAFHYADEGYSLLSLDYAQIELRILAELSNCKKYKEVFIADRDLHTETAKLIFNTEDITKEERRKAKAVNFAVIYGTTIFGLSEQIGCSQYEAKEIIKGFYRSYPEIEAYLSKVASEAEQNGYVSTMFGHRRYVQNIHDPIYSVRERAKREAINAPVQGSAAELIKVAMIKIDDFLKEGNYRTKLLLQIHDELIFAVPDDELEFMKGKISEIMTNAIPLSVPLKAEATTGKRWYDLKG